MLPGSEYGSAGIQPFLKHVEEFLNGERTVPVTKTSSVLSENTYFTFGSELYTMFIHNLEKMKKPYECALKYGYMGYSRGGKNGVFLIRRNEGRLLTATNSFVQENVTQIAQDLDCRLSEIKQLRRAMVVYHEPLGIRMVGFLNEKNGKAIFLGFAYY